MTTLTYNDIIDQLRTNVVEVTFTKVNGEKRVMPCTLSAEFIPDFTEEKVAVEKHSVNETVVRAYAIDKQAWRSFRVENVNSFEVIDA